MEFEVCSKVFLKISPIKSVTRFRKRGKLNSRFIGPFEILEQVGKVPNKFTLLPTRFGVHKVFHISMLYEYI